MNGSIQIKRDKYYAVVRFSDKAILHGALAEAYKKDMIAANPCRQSYTSQKEEVLRAILLCGRISTASFRAER